MKEYEGQSRDNLFASYIYTVYFIRENSRPSSNHYLSHTLSETQSLRKAHLAELPSQTQMCYLAELSF